MLDSFLLLLFLLCLLITGIFMFIYKTFDNKYPKIKFITIDGNVKRERYRRLAGTMIVPDNLIYIMLNEKKLMGDDIREYPYVYERGVKVYLAFEKNGVLIPLKIETEKIKLEDYMFAQDITIRYINTRENAREYIEKSNPLFMMIVNTAPYAILMTIFILGLYFTVNSIMPPLNTAMTSTSEKMENIAILQNQTLQTQKEILTMLQNINTTAREGNITNPSSDYDILISNPS